MGKALGLMADPSLGPTLGIEAGAKVLLTGALSCKWGMTKRP